MPKNALALLLLLMVDFTWAASQFSLPVFTLRATNSTLKGRYVKVHNKTIHAGRLTYDAVGVFTRNVTHADHFYTDFANDDVGMNLYYPTRDGASYFGITNDSNFNATQYGYSPVFYTNYVGNALLCNQVVGPINTTMTYHCDMNLDAYPAYVNDSFSWAIIEDKAQGLHELAISTTRQAIANNLAIVHLEAKIIKYVNQAPN